MFKQLAADVNTASSVVTATGSAAQSTTGQLDTALSQLRSMTAGKSDPRYAETLGALTAARTSAAGVQSALGGVQPKLAGAAGVSTIAAKQVGDLSVGLNQLYAGSNDLQGGIAKLRKGNADLAAGIGKLNTGGGQLTTGLGALNDGAAALESGLGQLTTGAGSSQSGLAGGQGPTGQLVGGLGQLQAGVAKFRGALPSTKDLEQLQRESPGLFDSGYFVLAAIAGRLAGQPGPGLLRGQPRSRRQRRADRGRPAAGRRARRRRASSATTSRRRPPRSRSPAAPRSPSAARPAT